MNDDRFADLLRSLAITPSRRATLRALVAVMGGVLTSRAGLGDTEEAEALRRRRRRPAGHRRHEQVGAEKKKKRKKKKKKASPPASPSPSCVATTCPTNACGSLPDGCGGTLSCGCAANQICRGGVCQACTVTCPTGSNPVTCGAGLQTALNGGGTVYVCPGRYQGNYTAPHSGVTVFGAGQGADPAHDTILQGNGSLSVMHLPVATGTVILEQVRVTGGGQIGGISHEGTLLQMRDCTVTGNTAIDFGGGISVFASKTLELTRCTVRDNHATGASTRGGGIYSEGTTTLTDCIVEDNDAGADGGGLCVDGGVTTLAGSTVVRGNQAAEGGGVWFSHGTLNVAASCQIRGNTATSTGGLFYDGFSPLNLAAGSRVCGNTAPTFPQCNFDAQACQDTCPA